MIILLGIIIYILYKDYLRQKAKDTTPGKGTALVKYANTPDRTRLYIVGGLIGGIYSVIFIWLNFAWYRLYARSKFHWFDDRSEWNQIDKAGHFFGAYFETVWAYELLRWSGLGNKRAAIAAAFIGMGFESSIEIWDGFSTKWGASWSDLTANAAGALLAMAQYLMWEEQRVMCKYSYRINEFQYPKGELSERANDLFGRTLFEKALKDYNNITLWLSINPSKFVPAIKPDWMCLAIGYGGENLYGGFENKWTDKDGKLHDRTDLPRNRLLKFSLDADLPRLRKTDPEGKAVMKVLNIVKMPFPSYTIRLDAPNINQSNAQKPYPKAND
ncbi:MAG TPA: DUF2279 domain-containing protein [Chitinophagales bacterium]|nr:DUF2279 domain-containing protein [Chitinophagales bacterium]